ncbi:MAG: hypothetical protein AAFY99_07400 [Pseudomonadota bacterium]
MKFLNPKTLGATLVALGAIAAPATATAGSWVESVKVERDGVDIVPIDVRANMGGYTSVKTSAHRFGLRLYARAKSGKRIAAGIVGSDTALGYFEYAGGSKWTRRLSHRDVGNGTLSTMDRTFSYNIPVSKLTWHGRDPLAACNHMMSQKMGQGMTRAAVLSQNHIVTARVYFEFEAVAAKKSKATKPAKIKIQNTSKKTDAYYYDVRVRCLSGMNKTG